MIFLDLTDGQVLAQRNQDIAGGVRPSDRMKDMANASLRKIVAIHNHPYSMLPSYSDLENAKRYKYGVIICHNGSVIKYSVEDNADIAIADNLHNYIQKKFVAREDLTPDLALLAELGIQMEVYY